MTRPVRTLTPSGEEIVILSATDFDRLVEENEDLRDMAVADRALAEGGEWLSSEEMKALLAASTPLQFWRKRRGLTQDALAQKVGVTQSYIAQIEAGKRTGEVGLYRRLADTLKVSIEDLLPGD